MTNEEKQLLFIDLCARLPYEVKLDNGLKLRSIDTLTQIVSCSDSDRKIDCVKPYIRPMSSMTEEELKEFRACSCVYDLHPNFHPMMCNIANELNMFDWLNAHHFDYRGLIGKGLALEASKDMYKTK